MNINLDHSKFFTALIEEIEAMDASLFLPKRAVGPEDKVIGEVNGWARKLWALSMMYEREKERLAVELRYEDDNTDLKERYNVADAKIKIFRELFWACVREELGAWRHDGVGLRVGWKFVEVPPTDAISGLRKLLEEL